MLACLRGGPCLLLCRVGANPGTDVRAPFSFNMGLLQLTGALVLALEKIGKEDDEARRVKLQRDHYCSPWRGLARVPERMHV